MVSMKRPSVTSETMMQILEERRALYRGKKNGRVI